MGKAKRFFGTNNTRNTRLGNSLSRQSNTLRSNNITPNSQLHGTPNSDYVRSTGGLHFGADGWIADFIDIASGVLDVTTNAAGDTVKVRKNINVNPETGTTDTLDLISTGGTDLPGQEMRLIGQSGDTITITHNSGSAAGNNKAILCPDDSDYTLSGDNVVTLFYDDAVGKWSIDGGSAAGGAGATFPLAYTVDDKGSVSGTVTHSLTASTAHKLQFTATGDCDITITGFGSGGASAVDFYIEVTQDGTGGHAITVNDAEWIDFPTLSTEADALSLVACHADGDGNMRAVILLNGTSTTAGASKELDNLTTTAVNADINMAGNSLTLDADADTYVESSTDDTLNFVSGGVLRMAITTGTSFVGDIVMSVGDDIDLNAGSLILDADQDTYIESVSDDTLNIVSGGVIRMAVTTGTSFVGNISMASGDDIDLNAGSVILDADQDTYIESASDDTMNFVSGGVLRMAITTGTSFVGDILMASGDDIDMNAGTIILDADQDTSVRADSDDEIQFKIGGVDALQIVAAGGLTWNAATVGHTLTAGSTNMTISLGASTDDFTFEFGSSAETITFDSGHETVTTAGATLGYFFESIHNDPSSADDTTIALYQWNYVNDVSTVEPHAQLSIITTDVSDGTEDCDFVFGQMINGTMTTTVTFDASLNKLDMTNGGKIDMNGGDIQAIGTFDMNSTPDVSGSRSGNAALADLLTELAALGLITDSTSA